MLNAILLQKLLRFDLLMEWMSLDLIDSRNDLVKRNQVHHSVGLEITYPNCSYSTFLV